MKGQRSNIIILLAAIGFMVFMAMNSQPGDRWEPTWHTQDKDAYGGYVTHQLMEGVYAGQSIRSAYKSLYELTELQDGQPLEGNLLIIANSLMLDENDSRALENYLADGHHVLVAASNLSGSIFDSLDIHSYTYPFAVEHSLPENAFVNFGFSATGWPKDSFAIEATAASKYFIHDKSKRDKVYDDYRSLAKNDLGRDVLRAYPVGEGMLYVSPNPLLLSNYYVLDSASAGYSAGMLSLLPPGRDITHIEFYQVGRMEANSPLRYFLAVPNLQWALYVSLIGLLLFIVFEARRRQRAIPVVKPLRNTSIEFAQTLGQLYFHNRGDHLNMARNRVNFLLEYIRTHYYLNTQELDAHFAQALIDKSGQPETRIHKLVNLAREVRQGSVTEQQFMDLEVLTNQFYGINETPETS
ncbi:MAG: DUF4350 domain-containing protein [Owenweeksia sp.]|nr:DUF4350 domain-containing protein [Owenweeksia sp.]